MTQIEVPLQLRGRPTYGGLPVPFVVGYEAGKIPGFSLNNRDLVLQAAEGRLCSQCGQPLEYYIAFVGGSDFFANRMFGEPGMHEECARYALKVCPHLAQNRVRSHRPTPEGVTILRHGGEGQPAAELWCLYITRSYKIGSTATGVPIFRVAPAARVHWFREGEEVLDVPANLQRLPR